VIDAGSADEKSASRSVKLAESSFTLLSKKKRFMDGKKALFFRQKSEVLSILICPSASCFSSQTQNNDLRDFMGM
jgi:hypothetical protein